MKELDKKDTPEISGGNVPLDGPCFPPFPPPTEEYPRNPLIPRTEDPVCPDLSTQ